jgi:branched-chain amino acid aminotransferase
MMGSWHWDKYHGENKQLKLCISSYQRPNPGALKMEAKVTGHYVNSILATSEAKVRGYDEALMLDMYGNVAESPGANFFMEKNGVLYTPSLGHILPGITRQTVINICRELDIQVKERTITPDELESADSAFLCGTAAEIVGIESIDAKPFRNPWFDSLGATIQEAYKCQVLEKSFSYVII